MSEWAYPGFECTRDIPCRGGCYTDCGYKRPIAGLIHDGCVRGYNAKKRVCACGALSGTKCITAKKPIAGIDVVTEQPSHHADGLDDIAADAHRKPLTGHDVFKSQVWDQAHAPDIHLPTDAKARKAIPMFSGLLLYFPKALAAVAEVSRIGNEQHNPGQPLHWDKTKSTDHGDCIVRHQCDAGKIDSDGGRHSAKVAWRALAQLEIELEREGK